MSVVAAALESAFARARAANPGIEVARDRFDAFVLARAAAPVTPQGLAELRVEALYLTCACADGDGQAIAAFERAYGRNVDIAVARAGGSSSAADEVRQTIRERLFTRTKDRPPRIADYAGRGDLGGWVRAAAARIAIDLHRTTSREVSSDDVLVERALPADDPEIAMVKARYAGTLNEALREAFAELPAAARNDLRLYYVDGLNLDEMARLDRVSAATISRRLARARDAVLAGTRKLLSERLHLELREIDSILGVMGSRFELGGSALGRKDP